MFETIANWKLNKKIVFAQGLQIAIFIIVGIYAMVLLSEQKDDGFLVNIAGRQRMLTQKLTKEVLLVGQGKFKKEDANKTIEIIDKTNSALVNGGDAPVTIKLDSFRKIEKNSNSSIVGDLRAAESLWTKFKNSTTIALDKDGKEIPETYMQESLDFTLAMDKVVKTIETESSDKMAHVYYAIIIGIVLFGAVTYFTAVMTIDFVRPIEDSAKYLHEMSDGNFKNVIPPAYLKRNDEIRIMYEAIDNIQNKIGAMISKIKQASESLVSATNDISEGANHISEGANQQAASFEELSSSVQSNSMNANNANELSQLTSKNAEEVGERMQNTVAAMEAIAKSAKDISSAVTLITEIADQTNLLALNAAIEAARAGQHGLGFAVVADEVRKLAERSSLSAQEISRIIGESLRQVDNGVKLTNDSGEKIEHIIQNIGSMATQIDSISTATQEQAATMEENTSIVSSNANSAEALTQSVKKLEEHAKQMNELVLGFKS